MTKEKTKARKPRREAKPRRSRARGVRTAAPVRRIYLLTVDGTSEGEYENAAFALLFATREGAVDYIEEDALSNTRAALCDDQPYAADALKTLAEEDTEWFGENIAQWRHGSAVVDYRIEMVPVPKEEE